MSRARTLSLLGNENALSVDSSTLDVGVGNTDPSADFMVGAGITMDGTAGVITATKYVGDGGELTGISASGIGTPVSTDVSSVLNKVYYTNQILTIPASVSVDVPSSAHVAYIQAAEVAVDSGADLTIADGDDFLTDALGIGSTGTAAALSGGGGRVRADNYTDRAATGAPTFTNGLQVTGVVTATTGSFSGNVTVGGTITYEDVTNVDSVGIVTAGLGLRATAGGLQVTAGVSTFGGGDIQIDGSAAGVSSVTWDASADTLEFKDNSVAAFGDSDDLKIYHTGTQSRIENSGTGELRIQVDTLQITDKEGSDMHIECNHDGNVELYYDNSKKLETTTAGVVITGIATVTVGCDFDGFKVEEGKQDGSTSLNGEFDFLLENGHIQRYSAATGGNYFPDFKVSSGTTLSSIMDVGDVISVTLIVASSSHYCTTGIKIDDSTSNVDLDWVGGSAPSAANGSGFDVYAFTIMKTAATPAYHIIGNALGVA